MAEESRDYRACRVYLRPGTADVPWAEVPCRCFEDLDIPGGNLLFTGKEGEWVALFAAGAWAYIDWVN